MNSSGIKRGLATTAVSALAVAGIPFIASSASAATGDSIALASSGPVRDGGALGGQFVFKTKGIDPNNLEVVATNLTGSADSPTQTVTIESATLVADGAAGDSNKTDGLDEITAYISVTTPSNGGGAFSFAVYEDEDGDGTLATKGAPDVDAAEARTSVSGTTVGAPTAIQVSPTLQSAPVNVNSGDYGVTLKDAGGNTTQLTTGESLTVSSTAGPAGGTLTASPAAFSAADLVTGTDTFVARGDTAGLYNIAVTGVGGAVAGKSGTASLDVAGNVASGIPTSDVNIVTGADSFNGFGNPGDATPNTFSVRPDQSSVTVNIRNATAGEVVILNVAGTGVTFGGKGSTQVRTTVAADGTATVNFAIDAASIQNGDSFAISGSTASTLTGTFASPVVSDVDANATTYVSAYGGTVSPTVTVTDQYGNPITGVFVTYDLDNGVNAGAESARKQVDSNGQVTFNITDTKATAASNASDDIVFRVYAGQFDATALATDNGSRIIYTADGQGANFLVTVDGQTPGGTAYNPVVKPLTDTTANNAGDSTDEFATLTIVGGTPNALVTVTTDNGGLILKNGENRLSQASASDTGEIGVDTFRFIGTEAGVVNVTVTSGGKTQTATYTVQPLAAGTLAEQANSVLTARNIAIEGPEQVVAGEVVEFTATITDAFGNPVRGFNPANINTLLTGPAQLKGNSGNSNEAGEIVFSVELNQDAKNPITFQVTGTTQDFGAAADRLTAASTTNDGVGLSASEATASASATVTNIEELEAAVEAAERDLAESEANLAVAQAQLDVAQTQLAIAQAEVDRLKERKQNLRKKLNKAKANDNKQKAKTTRKKLRKAKSDLRDAKAAAVVAQAAVDGQQTVVNLRQTEVDKAEEALEQAKQDLEDAKN